MRKLLTILFIIPFISTGNTFPGTSHDSGGGGTAWTNPTNAGADDAADATCVAVATSNRLICRNYGFAIPAGATIQGVTVRVEASEHSGGTEVLNAQLQNEGQTLIGNVKQNTISGTAKAIYTYGAADDLWGATLSTTTTNNSFFGVNLSFATAHDVRIDFVTLAVEYTVGNKKDNFFKILNR